MLWEVDIHARPGQPDNRAGAVTAVAAQADFPKSLTVTSARGFLLQGELSEAQIQHIAGELLLDPVVEQSVCGPVGGDRFGVADTPAGQLVCVILKPGVMDPVAQSAQQAIAEFGIPVEAVRTLSKYWIDGVGQDDVRRLADHVLANDAIEQVIFGPLAVDRLQLGSEYRFQRREIELSGLDDEGLMQLSRGGQLYLQLAEMQTIQAYYQRLGRPPSDVELETLAQTWSEHCSHKTLAGRIAYRDEQGERHFENMLRETIFAATEKIRRRLGEADWCVSVFEDNAGIVRFDERFDAVFKVETHNHPSAIEPYGGANTGIGGVIRDPLGTGLGAKPVCNTDVFCFAPPDTPAHSLPAGVLHPRRVIEGVVAGVRDYGNRMGIPTINGAVYFDRRYLGNPLVYCGNAGILPRDKTRGEPRDGDHIVVLGGRTGRDGIHGATFSSAELTSESESVSGGAVQIGNAITEKMLVDVILAARDRGLYHAITDCGAGGLSSAVGEMGEQLGAAVHLDRVPLKYEGLSYTEIWISEAQERMVLAVPEAHWSELHELCAAEGVEATSIGRFQASGRLELFYQGQQVADLAMEFLHDGRPPVVRQATYQRAPVVAQRLPHGSDFNETLVRILGSLNVASKHWIIRQYDHEVQGGSAIKPLVGVADGPGDAAVVRPVLDSRRGLVIACGMNPRYGDFDTYHMAASAIDEAVRNCVAVGADPQRIAILDNFCWGDCEKPETLGSLVRAAIACHDTALAFGTPFISGKDSLNNEFRYVDKQGATQTIAVPPSLLISAMGQVADVGRCVTMDLKQAGNRLYQVGITKNEMGGSHFALVHQCEGGAVPQVDAEAARETFAAVHRAVDASLVRACHDLSEGGLAVAAAEMAFAGGLGAVVDLDSVPASDDVAEPGQLLFSESNSRFLCEVPVAAAAEFEATLADVPHAKIGEVRADARLQITGAGGRLWVDADIDSLRDAWRKPLDW